MNASPRSLVALERRRYARQLLLVEIAETGQQRLCDARVRIAQRADSLASDVARDYLERAGVNVLAHDAPDASSDTADVVEAELAQGADSAPYLQHALAWLSGSLAAVETIKRIVHAGTPAPGLELVQLMAADSTEKEKD